MDPANPYTALKNALDKYFGFLKDAGFADFEKEQIAYEYHFRTRNNHVCIEVYIELISSTPVWVIINGHHIEDLEPDNEVFKQDHINIDTHLKELSAMLQRHPAVLTGNLDTMIKNEALRLQKREEKEAATRIEKRIYTVEYSLFTNDNYDCYEEFDNLDKMKQFIAELEPSGIYRILDPHMQEISL